MLGKFMGEKFYCGVDIGSQSVKAVIMHAGDQDAGELLGAFEVATRGYDNASVTDLGELSECIHSTVSSLVKKTGVKIKDVHLGIGGELVEKRRSNAIIPLLDRGTKVISERDIRKVRSQASLLGVSMEEVLLHQFPQVYKVDDVNSALNPLGLYGRKLEVNSLLLVVNGTIVKNITKAVNQAGYDVASLAFSSYAGAESVLSDYYRRQGCVLIDIGCSVTNVLAFRNGSFHDFVRLPIGGNMISGGIAKEMNLIFDLAEDIKRSYAVVHSAGDDAEEEILIKREEGYLPVKKMAINRAIDPVVTDLVGTIIQALKDMAVYDQLNGGIFMVGGGSLLTGLPELVEKSTNVPVKLGKVVIASQKMGNAVKYGAAVGLCLRGMRQGRQYTVKGNGHAGWINKVKELYQEYF